MRLARLAPAVLLSASLLGCATVHVDPALYHAKKIAIASVYARKAILFDNVPGLAPVVYDNDYGTEVIEMELGDTEGALGDLFGAEIVPAGKALQQKAYRALPEAVPAEDWTQVNDMTAVDVDSGLAAPALGQLARALHVDAVVVLRHEWALSRNRFEVNEGVTAYDRASILVVDAAGTKLWDDAVVVGAPASTVSLDAMSFGLASAGWPDEARQLARRTGRDALDALTRRYRSARPVEGKT